MVALCSLSKRSLSKRSLGRWSLRKCKCSFDGYLVVADGGYTNHPSHALYKIFTVSKLE